MPGPPPPLIKRISQEHIVLQHNTNMALWVCQQIKAEVLGGCCCGNKLYCICVRMRTTVNRESKDSPGTPLKGQCHEIFCFWFFSWISFPPAPEYPIRTVLNFFENSRRYSQVKVHHRYQRHWWQICQRCQRHRRQNCRRYQRHRRQICHQFRLCCWYRWQICHWCQWHRWQIMEIISGCWALKVNLKAKMFL